MTGQPRRILLVLATMLTAPLSTIRVAQAASAAAEDYPTPSATDWAVAATSGELTRREVLSVVLARSPQLRLYALDIRIADARRLQASFLPNPELGVEFENIGGTGDTRGFRGAETTIAVSQPIETAGKRGKRLAAASADSKVAEADYRARRSEILAEADKAFHELLAAQQTLGLATEQVDLAGRLSEAVGRRVSAGKDPAVEGSRAAIELAEAQLQRADAATAVEAARGRLSLLWGDEEPLFACVVGDQSEPLEPPDVHTLRTSVLDHPAVTRWTEAAAAAVARLRLAEARGTPDVTVMGGYRRLGADNDNALVFGLAIPLPVFDRNKAGRLEAHYELARIREQAAAARTEMLGRLALVHTRLTAAARRAQVLQSSILPNAAAAYDAALIGYQQGKFDYLNVLDAQRTYFDVQQKAVAAMLEYHRVRADLEAITECPLEAIAVPTRTVSSNTFPEVDSNEP